MGWERAGGDGAREACYHRPMPLPRPSPTLCRSAALALALTLPALPACGARSSLEVPPGARPGKPATYCKSDSDTSVYVVSAQNTLYRFEAPTGTFAPIGTFSCPAKNAAARPFSMAVDHLGVAHVIFDDGELFEISGKTAACTATAFVPAQSPVGVPFGGGFAATLDEPGETYFVAGTLGTSRLGKLDPEALTGELIGTFSKDIGDAELTGTGDGRLFAFGVEAGLAGGHFAEIDPQSATVLSDAEVPTPADPRAWAFAFWGGDFYFFTSVDDQSTTVGKLSSTDGTFTPAYATLPGATIVGAGVSTCAPL